MLHSEFLTRLTRCGGAIIGTETEEAKHTTNEHTLRTNRKSVGRKEVHLHDLNLPWWAAVLHSFDPSFWFKDSLGIAWVSSANGESVPTLVREFDTRSRTEARDAPRDDGNVIDCDIRKVFDAATNSASDCCCHVINRSLAGAIHPRVHE